MNKLTIILIILLVLILIVAAVVLVPMFTGGNGSGGSADAEPAQSEERLEDSSDASEIVNVLPTVETEEIDGTVTDTGSFVSNTETGLDVQVEWSIFDDSDGNRKVRLDVSLKCYNLYVSERYDGISIKLGDSNKTIDSARIDYTGSAATILIGSAVMDMPEGAVDCEVSWAFKGTYNNTELDTVTATGIIG